MSNQNHANRAGLCPLISDSTHAIACQASGCAWWLPGQEGNQGRCAVVDLVSVTAGVMYPYLKEGASEQAKAGRKPVKT